MRAYPLIHTVHKERKSSKKKERVIITPFRLISGLEKT